MDPEFLKYFSTLGIGGVLAGFMFMFYRKDVKQYTELWKTMTEQMMKVITENTSSNARLISMLENIERNSMRKSDVESFIRESVKSQQRG